MRFVIAGLAVAVLVLSVVLTLVGRMMLAGVILFLVGFFAAAAGHYRLHRMMRDAGISWFETHYIPGVELYYSIKYWQQTKYVVLFSAAAYLVMILGGAMAFIAAIVHDG